MAAPSSLLIFGASARAAAFSALRAGFQPWCADLFADLDLQARCPVLTLDPGTYPDGFAALSLRAPAGPWTFTGGLENRPRLVDAIAQHRTLWGNDAAVLGRVRSPAVLTHTCQEHGLPHPAICLDPARVPASTRWLIKPTQGAGGTGIQFFRAEFPRRQQVYYQEYIDGDSYGALFLGDGLRTRLIGVTRQLVGEGWLHATPFHYCGSIGPAPCDDSLMASLQRLGTVLAEHCEVRGLFGIDCVVKDSVPYPVEVNPRYTASVEVLEHASGTPALSLHRRVFDPGSPDPVAGPVVGPVVGKAILFARQPLTFPTDGPWMTTLQHPGAVWDLPAFADIPAAGTPIKSGRPVLTFFARAGSVEECRAALQELAADLDRWIYST